MGKTYWVIKQSAQLQSISMGNFKTTLGYTTILVKIMLKLHKILAKPSQFLPIPQALEYQVFLVFIQEIIQQNGMKWKEILKKF